MRRLLAGGARQDRLVAIVRAIDGDQRFVLRFARVVAVPLAEWTLARHVGGMDPAFEHDVGTRRERQAGRFAFDQLHRPVHHPAAPIVLGHTVGHRVGGGEIRDRVDADDDHDRTRFPGLEILVAMDAALLAVRDVGCEQARSFDHHAIGADVDTPGIGIARHHTARRADVTAAVLFVVYRDREHLDVDVLTAHDVLAHRTVLDDHRRNLFVRLLDVLAEVVELRFAIVGQIRFHPEHQTQPVRRAEHAVLATIARRVAGNVVEDQHRRFLDLLPVQHLGDGAQLLIPMRPANGRQLALRLDPGHERSQIVLRCVGAQAFGRAGTFDRRRHVTPLL